MQDEIASLVALCLGIRLNAGGFTHVFEPGKDPRGRPVSWYSHQNPVLVKPSAQGAILPGVLGEHDLREAGFLSSLSTMCASDCIALTRSARLYQDAVWIAEAQTHLAWLLLVSSIETAANQWRRKMRPTKKFVEFILTFLPPPPSKRPAEYAQHPWDNATMRQSLAKIYQWRSRALHDGTPFPAPMCIAPHEFHGGLIERQLGFSMSTMGGVWSRDDAPMLLHVFEYIVRNVLIAWWKTLVNQSPDT